MMASFTGQEEVTPCLRLVRKRHKDKTVREAHTTPMKRT